MKSFKDIFSLEGKTAVITGGAGLLGKYMVKSLSDFGAEVIVADVILTEAERIAKEIKNAQAFFLDITSETSVSKLIDQLATIDIWVNNAYPRTDDWGLKFEDVPFESWRQNVDMHLNGYFLCCQKVARKMTQQKSGSIINMSSIYGLVAPKFNIYEGIQMTSPAAYSAIKGGIVNFTRYLASYLGPFNVRANVLCPGGIYDNQPEDFVRKYRENTPLKRMGRPEDIMGPLIFLASDASKYVTGLVLTVDGGWTAC